MTQKATPIEAQRLLTRYEQVSNAVDAAQDEPRFDSRKVTDLSNEKFKIAARLKQLGVKNPERVLDAGYQAGGYDAASASIAGLQSLGATTKTMPITKATAAGAATTASDAKPKGVWNRVKSWLNEPAKTALGGAAYRNGGMVGLATGVTVLFAGLFTGGVGLAVLGAGAFAAGLASVAKGAQSSNFTFYGVHYK